VTQNTPVAFSTINFESIHKSTRSIFGADENCNSERPKTEENYPNSTTILEFRLLDRSRTSAVFTGKAGSKTPVCLKRIAIIHQFLLPIFASQGFIMF
jgi:hypothetical protein